MPLDETSLILAALSAPLAALPASALLFATVAVLVGYLVLGVAGFGSALVIVPALAWRWPLATVVPLVLLLDLPASLLHAWLNRRDVRWQELTWLLPGMVVGVGLGAAIAPYSQHPAIGFALGAYVMVVATRAAMGKAPVGAASHRYAPLAGVAAGVIESLLGTAGPVVIYWLSRRLPDARAVRATTPMVLMAVTLLALMAMAVNGQLSQPIVLAAWLPLLPVAWGGVALGHHLAHRLPARRLAQAIWMGLALSGAAMAIRALA